MNPKESFLSFAFLVHLVFLVSCGIDSPLPTPVSYIDDPSPRLFERIPNDPRGKTLIEREFLPLVEKFEMLRGKGQVQTPIYFVDDLSNSVLGVCIVWRGTSSRVSEIKINRKTYGRSEVEAEMIIFHELAHCELNRPHTEDFTRSPDGRLIPYSLMYPNLFLSSDYNRFHEHYVMELFERGNLLEKVESDTFEKSEAIEVIQSNGFEGYVYH